MHPAVVLAQLVLHQRPDVVLLGLAAGIMTVARYRSGRVLSTARMSEPPADAPCSVLDSEQAGTSCAVQT